MRSSDKGSDPSVRVIQDKLLVMDSGRGNKSRHVELDLFTK